MIWGLAAIALFVSAGLGLTHRLDREAHGTLLIAESVLVGGGVAAAAFAFHWALVIPFILWSAVSRPPIALRPTKNGLVAAALPVPILVWHAIFATRSDLYDWTNWLISRRDFYFIWGYKARLIFASGSVPWSFLQSLPNDFTPRAYPLLVPLQFAVPSILARAWQPQAAGIVETLLAAAALVIAWHELPPRVAGVGTLALAGCALLQWPGFADGPLTAYLTSAALLLRSKRCDPLAAVLLALAAMTKDEGIAFVAGAAIAVVLTDPKRWRTFIFPVAVVVIWLFSQRHTTIDIAVPGLWPRVAHNLPLFPKAFATVGTSQPVVWITALLALTLSLRENLSRERFLLLVIGFQLAFYFGAYAGTMSELVGQVNASWDRISSHVTMLVAFVGLTSIASALPSPTEG